MAILNGIIKKLNGSAGQLTFKQVNGQTVVSEKVTTVKNTRTSAQQKHRMKWANMVQMYKGISPLLLSGFENKAQGVSDYNMFMKVNINVSPVYLSKQDVNAGACIAAPYQLTQGTLPSIVISGTGGTRKTDINLGTLAITASTKVKEFSNAVVQNNADYEYGDQISFFLVKQLINQATLVPYCQFSAWSVILDKDSDVKLWDQVYQYGFSADGGVLAHGNATAEGDAVYCWVHSRKESGKTKVSTQFLLDNNSKLANYTSSDAYQSAVETYGGESDVFLTPDGAPSAGSGTGGNSGTSTTKYTLTLSASPTAGGSVSGSGQYNAGQSVQISATANSGYTFTRWNDGVTTSSRTVTMDANKTLSAIFTTDGTPDPNEGDEVNNLH